MDLGSAIEALKQRCLATLHLRDDEILDLTDDDGQVDDITVEQAASTNTAIQPPPESPHPADTSPIDLTRKTAPLDALNKTSDRPTEQGMAEPESKEKKVDPKVISSDDLVDKLIANLAEDTGQTEAAVRKRALG